MVITRSVFGNGSALLYASRSVADVAGGFHMRTDKSDILITLLQQMFGSLCDASKNAVSMVI